MYREVLRSVEEHAGKVRTDELQQLHTIHNLQEILVTKPTGILPTLRDGELVKQVRMLYMYTSSTTVHSYVVSGLNDTA